MTCLQNIDVSVRLVFFLVLIQSLCLQQALPSEFVNMVLVLILECSMRAYENLGEQKQCHGCCLSTTLSHDRLR